MSYQFTTVDTPEAKVPSFSLAGELCVFHAADIRPQLMEIARGDKPSQVDLSGVTEVDTAGLQLLLVAKKEANRHGCALSFVGHSGPLLEMIELLNLSQEFGNPLLPTTRNQEVQHEPR